MAAFNKFNAFATDLINGRHDFSSHVFRLMLTDVAPVAADDAVKADLTEIDSGNGYGPGGPVVTMQVSNSSGTAKVSATDLTITAIGGPISPFRYCTVYNDTQSSPLKPLVGFYDYGLLVTLVDAESFTVDFDDSNGFITIG